MVSGVVAVVDGGVLETSCGDQVRMSMEIEKGTVSIRDSIPWSFRCWRLVLFR